MTPPVGPRILSQAVIGHKRTLEFWHKAKSQSRIPQSWMLSGTSGIGKKLIALSWAQSLLCEMPKSTDACGQCDSCRKVASANSPNVLIVAAEEGKTQISVEQIRKVLEFTQLRSERPRAIIIDGAHELNLSAAQILLKTLEEPPVGIYFFLVTHQASLLPATIRSRLIVVPCSPLEPEQIQRLTHCEDWVARAARGSLEVARQLMDEDLKPLRDLGERGFLLLLPETVVSTSALQSTPSSRDKNKEGDTTIEEIRQAVKDRRTAQSLLLFWLQWARDLRMSYATTEAMEHVLHQDFFASYKNRLNVDPRRTAVVDQLFCYLQGALADVHGNVDRALIFENIFLFKSRLKLSGLGSYGTT